jgi:hypothetical protein
MHACAVVHDCFFAGKEFFSDLLHLQQQKHCWLCSACLAALFSTPIKLAHL